jgi:hypothetical protein
LHIRLLLSIFFLVTLSLEWAWAHGGGTLQLTNVEVGPYRVSVWSLPDPLRVGDGHFTVAVSKPMTPGTAPGAAGPPVFDAKVELQLTPVKSDGQTYVVPATHESAVNKLFYEGDFELPTAGLWRVAVAVEGTGAAAFEIEVLPPAGSQAWLWTGLVLCIAVIAWLALWGLGVWRSATREPRGRTR